MEEESATVNKKLQERITIVEAECKDNPVGLERKIVHGQVTVEQNVLHTATPLIGMNIDGMRVEMDALIHEIKCSQAEVRKIIDSIYTMLIELTTIKDMSAKINIIVSRVNRLARDVNSRITSRRECGSPTNPEDYTDDNRGTLVNERNRLSLELYEKYQAVKKSSILHSKVDIRVVTK